MLLTLRYYLQYDSVISCTLSLKFYIFVYKGFSLEKLQQQYLIHILSYRLVILVNHSFLLVERNQTWVHPPSTTDGAKTVCRKTVAVPSPTTTRPQLAPTVIKPVSNSFLCSMWALRKCCFIQISSSTFSPTVCLCNVFAYGGGDKGIAIIHLRF